MTVTLAVALLGIAYASGVTRLRGRATRNGSPTVSRMLALGAGLLVIECALASPLDALAGKLLSAHMLQHLLLMLVAPPLLVWARPVPYFVWSLPRPLRKGVSHLWHEGGLAHLIGVLRRPMTSWAVFCAVVVLWHIPALYRWAMSGVVGDALMQLSFLIAGLLFWSVVIPGFRKRALGDVGSALFVFAAALVTALPGALIAFARQPLYCEMGSGPLPFGLSALSDQQLAGLIMWIPMDLTLFGVALVLLAAGMKTKRRDSE